MQARNFRFENTVLGDEDGACALQGSKHGGDQEGALPRHISWNLKCDAASCKPSLPRQDVGRKGPVQKPHEQPSMPSSRSNSSLEAQPNVENHDFAEQPTVAAKPGEAASLQPNAARANGLQQSRHSEKEVSHCSDGNLGGAENGNSGYLKSTM